MPFITCIRCGQEAEKRSHNQRYCRPCAKTASKEASRERKRREYHRNPDKLKARAQAWREANRERSRAHNQRWKEKNPERYREGIRRWHATNRDRGRAAWRRYRARCAEWHRERAREWRRSNPELVREAFRRRYARKRGATGSHTPEEFRLVCRQFGWRCAYCDVSLTEETATRDHLLPISRGGSDDIDNIVPACISCNSAKGTKTPEEFLVVRMGVS